HDRSRRRRPVPSSVRFPECPRMAGHLRQKEETVHCRPTAAGDCSTDRTTSVARSTSANIFDMGFLSTDTQAPVRTEPTATADVNLWSRILYVRSYLLERAIIGFIGITLPIVLIVGDHLLGPNAPFLRSALSDYYYSGTRDVFVGAMFSIGVFLVTYKI